MTIIFFEKKKYGFKIKKKEFFFRVTIVTIIFFGQIVKSVSSRDKSEWQEVKAREIFSFYCTYRILILVLIRFGQKSCLNRPF